jgi:tRNA dimethylallyltransferase
VKLPVLVLVGPTAVGKTAISIGVAKRIGAEIISGDSMQLYRGMDIGTAKITQAEMQGVPHHMIDILAPDAEFAVAEFQVRVDRLIREIHGRGRLPMIVGGTGLYIRSVLAEYTFSEIDTDQLLRQRLAAEEKAHGPGYLHRRLQDVDPAAAARLHPNDTRRVIRALEVFETTGRPISATQTAADHEPRYDDLLIGLTMERELLYRRIDERVDQMLAAGWLTEARQLFSRYAPDVTAMQAIGYRELVQYLRGLLTWPETVAVIKRHTRQYAKRQLTWFRREARMRWIDVTHAAARALVVEEIANLVEGKWQKPVEPER